MDEYELKQLVNYLVSKQKRSAVYDSCDFYQEAMLVVPIAIKTWDKRRNTALKTHLTNCIVNRFKDLQKSQYRRPEFLIDDCEDEVDLAIPDDPIAAFEFDLTMKQILSSFEFAVYRRHYVYGNTTRDIAVMFKTSTKRLNKCLQSICQKYQSLEESLQKISTQRKLSENFLSFSERAS